LARSAWLQIADALIMAMEHEVVNASLAARAAGATAHYEQIVRFAPDIIFLIDDCGSIVEANEAACAAYGYGPQEIIGMHASDLRTAEAVHDFERQWQAATRPGGVTFETEHRRKDGSRFPVEISARAIHIDGVRYRICFLRDITDRKTAADALRAQQSVWQQTLDTMLEGCQIVGFDWRFRYINDAAQRQNRRPNAECLGRTVLECWPDIESSELFAAFQRCFEQRVTQQLEVERFFPDGDRGWYRTVLQPVPEGLAMYSEDITRRKLAEQELRASEERLRLALDTARMGIYDWILATNRITWSRWHETIFGYAPGEFDGTYAAFIQRVHPDDRAALREQVARCRESKLRYTHEYRVVWPDGSVRWVAGTGQFEYDAAGQATRMIGVVLDIGERKQADQEIHRLNANLLEHAADLEQRVAVRTVELEFAKTRAEDADRAKSRFLNTMSHELRTPLNAIVGFTELLLDELPGPLNAEQKHQLGIVQDSSRQLLALINDVLDISRIEVGELRIAQGKFDLAEVLDRVGAAFSPQLAKRGLKLELDCGTGPAIAYGDERRVQQIINNLMSNALKFTPAGSVSITLARKEDQYALTIADTGIGIKPEDMDRLFKPFSQIEGGLKVSREGTGLGLAITRHLVEAMGGEIEVASIWGVGSRFTFTLPAGEAI
jgi:PAS domain S-box-containing protein